MNESGVIFWWCTWTVEYLKKIEEFQAREEFEWEGNFGVIRESESKIRRPSEELKNRLGNIFEECEVHSSEDSNYILLELW